MTTGGAFRRFVALQVPVQVRDLLVGAVGPVLDDHAAARATRPDGWHVTLAFCGDVDDDRRDELIAVVGAVAADRPPVALAWDGLSTFSDRVLAVGIADEPAGSVAALGARVQAALGDVGLPVVRQRVYPHCTLARRRSRAAPADWQDVRGRVARALDEVRSPSTGRWQAREVAVWRAEPTDAASRYVVEASLPLAAAD